MKVTFTKKKLAQKYKQIEGIRVSGIKELDTDKREGFKMAHPLLKVRLGHEVGKLISNGK